MGTEEGRGGRRGSGEGRTLSASTTEMCTSGAAHHMTRPSARALAPFVYDRVEEISVFDQSKQQREHIL
eukprot:2682376-Pyramimonas_sp.AAC.1